MTIHTIEIDLKKLSEKTGLTQIAPVARKPVSRRCDNCNQLFAPADDRSRYHSKTCRSTILNFHRRVEYAFRSYAALGFTLTWEDPKLFYIELPKSDEYPVPDGFAFHSHYGLPEDHVEKWSAPILIHNALYGEKTDTATALEIAVAHAGTDKGFWEWFYFFGGVRIPTKECPDCHKHFAYSDLWWGPSMDPHRDELLCHDCYLIDVEDNRPF